jgi:hypothetical protein
MAWSADTSDRAWPNADIDIGGFQALVMTAFGKSGHAVIAPKSFKN